MIKYRRKSGSILLTVFTAILITTALQSPVIQAQGSHKQAVIHTHEYSGESTVNISRSFSDYAGFHGRIFLNFTCQNLVELHSNLSHTSFSQVNFSLEQFCGPIKVYKLVKKFLI